MNEKQKAKLALTIILAVNAGVWAAYGYVRGFKDGRVDGAMLSNEEWLKVMWSKSSEKVPWYEKPNKWREKW